MFTIIQTKSSASSIQETIATSVDNASTRTTNA
jgi:hypothetical protein